MRRLRFASALGGRGTTLNPGGDLGRMALGLDLRAISIAEGLRAALASATLIIANIWIGSPLLVIAAIGAQLTCFCDTGGVVYRRAPAQLAFAVLGGATWALFGLLRTGGLPAVLPAAAFGIFLTGYARVYGLKAQSVGNILVVVLALALDRPLGPAEALTTGVTFTAGGLWAVLLTVAIWRIHPERPAQRAVADVLRLLAALCADLRGLIRDDAAPAAWEAHARGHRRAVRDAIERARDLLSDTMRLRGPLSARTSQLLLRLEITDQLFGLLIGLSDVVEYHRGSALRHRAATLLRVTRPLLALARAGVLDRPVGRPERVERAIAELARPDPDAAELDALAKTLAARLRLGAKLSGEEAGDQANKQTGKPAAVAARDPLPLGDRLLGPLRADFRWRSAILRHAVRAVAVGVPAVAFALIWVGPFQHWLLITVVLTMQPFIAATWQRAIERIAGTVLGALIGGVLALLPQTPLVTALLLVPLSVIGFSARQVSYGTFIALLTPLTVILIESIEPGRSEWEIAGFRILFTLLGGGAAVLACLVLWPSSEPTRLRAELRTTLRCYAAWSERVLAAPSGSAEADAARRAAGVAHNNLEASLSRALQEPRRRRRLRERLEAALVADATLRRMGATLTALVYDPELTDALGPQVQAPWRDWLPAALRALADRQPVPDTTPDPHGSDSLGRIGRQVELLAGALQRAP